ncbi:hypothetical protein N7491_009978 [Penicillium cf. griseofulvum]|uniref:Uncharacterized protein n=1 Tax=Penicillium cf. griseofulvum TaxID=2972120 RepID=A0A9W9T5M9_9EURO|nr:hypothetical protein N7472_000310 [Penicillium cf. griseofulvum]KAJ5421533.1 hypothetical protein N7491_009978 [Penicillium cf. griseofulvum]KAJ5424768.1 hypothetical protein N7445_010741 [Penicillium cf. griseofulvum]
MSESFAILRQRRSDELAKLADEHLQHDLQPGDRDKLNAAASSISLWTTVGSAVGVSLGLLTAIRLRGSRKAFFSAIRAQQKPTKVVFEDGRTESIPDLTPLLKPTTLGDVATYFFASVGGLLLGGELGFAGGVAKGTRTITSDPESKKRIETAFGRFRADVLRKEADAWEKGVHDYALI